MSSTSLRGVSLGSRASVVWRRALRRLVPLGLLFSLAAIGCGPLTPQESDAPAALSQLQQATIPTGYYDTATGKTGTALLQALADRTYNGHKGLSYTGARDQ